MPAQEPQAPAVGDHAPQVIAGTVQQLLDEPVRADPGGSRDARGPRVEVHVPPDEVQRKALPRVRNGIGAALDLDRAHHGQAPVAKLGEDWEQPAFPGQCRGGIGRGDRRERRLKAGPGPSQPSPACGDCLVEPRAVHEVIRALAQTLEPAIA